MTSALTFLFFFVLCVVFFILSCTFFQRRSIRYFPFALLRAPFQQINYEPPAMDFETKGRGLAENRCNLCDKRSQKIRAAYKKEEQK